MDAVLQALSDQHAELAALVRHRTEDELAAPSRCPGWSAGDVLLHLAQTDEMAVASIEGRVEAFMHDAATRMTDAAAGANVDDWAGSLVAVDRTTGITARDRWLAASEAQRAAFATVDPAARLTWVAGELAARSLATTRLSECWIHTVDIAIAWGDPPPPTDRLWHIARLAWRTVPYAAARGGAELAGSVAFALEAPDGSTWHFGAADAPTVVTGTALDLCTVAGQRAVAADAGLAATGPDAATVLRLVRTFA